MFMRTAGAALALALGAAAPVQAQDPAVIDDIRCAAVGFIVTTSEEASVKQAGLLMSLYFYGRATAHLAAGDRDAAFIRVIDQMDADGLEAEADRCGKEFESVGEDMSRLGEKMVAGSADR